MLNPDMLYNNIRDAINGRKVDITRSIPAVSGNTTDLSGTATDHVLPSGDAGWDAVIRSIAEEVVKHIQQNMEIQNGQFTLLTGSLTGELNGAGGGPAPVVVTGGTITSETGTVSIPAGAIK